ncbi:meprin A subunit beta-like [Engraulis encrasicolus]|uniref:meprin A subunit beta-like n=1 Tax=Engraulis encrasicolus TaxID=184585 RepID=UPI002FD3FCB9
MDLTFNIRTMLAFLLIVLSALEAFSTPMPLIIDIEDESHSIPDINEAAGLHLFDGDIMMRRARSSILGEDKRWSSPVPYLLESSLDLHAKGIILRALEQFRLKTCIDFTPRLNENPYIGIKKDVGCWSSIGKSFSSNQPLSIGSGCENIAIVEHEFFHALGFYHEQSRYDRDDHVIIVVDNIREGYEHNFKKVSEDDSSLLNTPYDYTSVMHYGKNAFTNGNGNGTTILTKNPDFQDVIGQRVEMSPTDTLELNRLYHCNESVSFVEQCSFDEESMCEMTVCSRGPSGWKRVNQTDGGPHSDHTYLGTDKQGQGLFMHFSTVTGEEGDSSRLITRVVTPSRLCQIQCLQFYYYYNGNETDQLNIWIREFDSKYDVEGTRKLMGQITASAADYWQLHHVPLNATKIFQVEFGGRKGAGSSSGGFSVDDVNLSETECPHQTWQIRNFEELLSTSASGTYHYSPIYYTIDGYGYQILLRLRVTYFSLYMRLVSGDYDDQLEWPLAWRQFTFLVVDQNPNIQHRMSKQRSRTTDPAMRTSAGHLYWDNPRENGFQINENGEIFYVSYGYGYGTFMTLDELQQRDFLKGGDVFISFFMQDIRPLSTNHSLPCPAIPQLNVMAISEESNYSCLSTSTIPTTEESYTATTSSTPISLSISTATEATTPNTPATTPTTPTSVASSTASISATTPTSVGLISATTAEGTFTIQTTEESYTATAPSPPVSVAISIATEATTPNTPTTTTNPTSLVSATAPISATTLPQQPATSSASLTDTIPTTTDMTETTPATTLSTPAMTPTSASSSPVTIPTTLPTQVTTTTTELSFASTTPINTLSPPSTTTSSTSTANPNTDDPDKDGNTSSLPTTKESYTASTPISVAISTATEATTPNTPANTPTSQTSVASSTAPISESTPTSAGVISATTAEGTSTIPTTEERSTATAPSTPVYVAISTATEATTPNTPTTTTTNPTSLVSATAPISATTLSQQPATSSASLTDTIPTTTDMTETSPATTLSTPAMTPSSPVTIPTTLPTLVTTTTTELSFASTTPINTSPHSTTNPNTDDPDKDGK